MGVVRRVMAVVWLEGVQVEKRKKGRGGAANAG